MLNSNRRTLAAQGASAVARTLLLASVRANAAPGGREGGNALCECDAQAPPPSSHSLCARGATRPARHPCRRGVRGDGSAIAAHAIARVGAARAQRQGDARAAIPCMSAIRKLPRHPPILCGRAALQGPPPPTPGCTRRRPVRPHAAAAPAPARASARTNARVASVPGSSTRSPVVISDIVIN